MPEAVAQTETERLAEDARDAAPDIKEVIQDVPGFLKEAKAGYKTTEFWVTLFGVFATQIGAIDLPGKYGKTIQTVALLVAYVVSRGLAKAGVPTVE